MTKFRLGDWIVEADSHTLRNGSEVRHIEPKAMAVLLALAREPGEVVSKQELMAAVWGDCFVSDGVLTTAVYQLRKALDESARSPGLIETIPTRGYRLTRKPTTDAPRPDGVVAVWQRSWVASATLLVALLLASLTGWLALHTSVTAPPFASNRSLSVEGARAYQAGWENWSARTATGLRQALRHFEQSVDHDPYFGQGFAAVAMVNIYLAAHGHEPPLERCRQARVAAARAMDLQGDLATTQATQGLVRFVCDWDVVSAERLLRQAIESEPSLARAHSWLAQVMVATGRNQEALSEASIAQALEPDSLWTQMAAAFVFKRLDNLERARSALAASLGVAPTYEPALISLRSMEASSKPFPSSLSQLLMDSRGQPEALRLRLTTVLNRSHVPCSVVARLYLRLGEWEVAAEWLERAVSERESTLLFLRTDAALLPLARQVQPVALVSQLGI